MQIHKMNSIDSPSAEIYVDADSDGPTQISPSSGSTRLVFEGINDKNHSRPAMDIRSQSLRAGSSPPVTATLSLSRSKTDRSDIRSGPYRPALNAQAHSAHNQHYHTSSAYSYNNGQRGPLKPRSKTYGTYMHSPTPQMHSQLQPHSPQHLGHRFPATPMSTASRSGVSGLSHGQHYAHAQSNGSLQPHPQMPQMVKSRSDPEEQRRSSLFRNNQQGFLLRPQDIPNIKVPTNWRSPSADLQSVSPVPRMFPPAPSSQTSPRGIAGSPSNRTVVEESSSDSSEDSESSSGQYTGEDEEHIVKDLNELRGTSEIDRMRSGTAVSAVSMLTDVSESDNNAFGMPSAEDDVILEDVLEEELAPGIDRVLSTQL